MDTYLCKSSIFGTHFAFSFFFWCVLRGEGEGVLRGSMRYSQRILFPLSPLGTIVSAPSYFIYCTYLYNWPYSGCLVRQFELCMKQIVKDKACLSES
jgi:hypothetical protein